MRVYKSLGFLSLLFVSSILPHEAKVTYEVMPPNNDSSKVASTRSDTSSIDSLGYFDPNAEAWSLVKVHPSVNKPMPLSDVSSTPSPGGSSISSVNNSSSIKTKASTNANGTFISSHMPPVVNVPSIIPSSLLAQSTAMRILTAPIRALVMRSFEGYRRLLKDAHKIEDSIRSTLNMPKRVRLRSLDPLDLPEPVVLEHRDRNIPILGKLVFTLSDIVVSGLSNFKVEQLDGFGRHLQFQHVVPHLDSLANYTMDYHLFDVIPFRVSSGHLLARVPNARVKGSFQIFPDLANVWFRVAQLNLTTWVEDFNIRFYPQFLISERFAIDKTTVDKIHEAFNHFIPNITDILRLTYTKAIEMKLT